MCGIAGVFNYGNVKPVDEGILRSMCHVIAHRGPDGEGLFVDPEVRVGLGHRRLSIIDLEGGAQPMSNADESVWIVFNGEIYNYPELKEELQGKGYKFRTRSDTEVIIHMYSAYGEAAFDRLNGIFSFALYDKNKKSLILARDHYGVKPLYYWNENGKLLFSSEIKAILQDPDVARRLDIQAFDAYMTFRYSPSPQTLFQGIKKLYPGYCLKFSAHEQTLRSYRRPPQKINDKISEKDAVAEYRRLLENAVSRQLLSDVPVGLLLSGGVDSAVLGFLMQKHYTGKIKTFTIGFEGAGDYNELADAKATADLLGSEHYEMMLSKDEYMNYFFQSFTTTEEPIAQTTIPALYYVTKLASQHLKVVLAGQGADEPMAGYPRYLGARFLSQYAALFRLLPMDWIAGFFPLNEKINRAAFVSRASSEMDRFLSIYTIFTPEEKKQLYKKDLREQTSGLFLCERLNQLYAESSGLKDPLSKILYMDTRMSLSDNLLNFNDKVTMANSIEMRVPFLDTELVDFLETLPSSMKLKGTQRKYIHKKAVEAWLPKEIIYRKKRGFNTPMEEWLQADLGNQVRELVNEPDSACREYFNVDFINQMIERHQRREANYQQHIFLLLSFELWHRSFFKGAGKPAEQGAAFKM